MMTYQHRARLMIGGLLSLVLVVSCDRLKTELLAPQNPGLVDPSAVASVSAAMALRAGALGRFRQVVAGESIWQMGGTLVDEYKNADFEVGRISADQRVTDPLTHNWNYDGVTRSRGFVRDAISAMRKYAPDSSAVIGELYMALAFFEMTLADNYCNGIPLGSTIDGVMTNGSPLTIIQVYDSASAHLDTAMALSAVKADSASLHVNRISRVFKARVLIAKDRANAPAAATVVASVPTQFQYLMEFSSNSAINGAWTLNNSVARISVADSFDNTGTIKNALPFASANDPRVPVINGDVSTPKVPPEDGATRPFYVSLLYKGQFDPLVMASGIDARLYEAEGKLQGGDIAGMMTILNALRAAPRTIGIVVVPALAPLPTPADANAAATLLFREKAFWTFGRGQRLPDLRRLIRQYGRTQEVTFPNGTYFKGGVYGPDVNYPVPTVEQSNPLFSACTDRKA